MSILINKENIILFMQNIASITDKTVTERIIKVTSDLIQELKTFPSLLFKIVNLGRELSQMSESLNKLSLLTELVNQITETSLTPVPLPVAWRLLLEQTGRMRIYFDRLGEKISYHEAIPQQHILVLQILIQATEVLDLALVINQCFIFARNEVIDPFWMEQVPSTIINILKNNTEVLFKQYVSFISQPVNAPL